MYAVIKTGGKQHKVKPGDVIEVELIHKGNEERVTFAVDFEPPVALERLLKQPAVVGEQVRVALARPLQQSGRALDIAEQQRHRAAWGLGHVSSLSRAREIRASRARA